ncbi:MAG: DUF655 domain-containing protein [Candidatus Micrarchaeia archaeon]
MFGREEQALVLDFLPYGKSAEARKEPVVQLLGDAQFTLLEATPKLGVVLSPGETVYVGKDERPKIDRIKGRITWRELTNAAQHECRTQLLRIVKEREPRFVEFLNRAGAINIRSHSLEHLPAVGKKHLTVLLEQREKKPFESFADVHARVPHLGRIEDLIAQRIEHELGGDAKYYLFSKPIKKEDGY